jgi:hyperpolarization activated cyclic nucleotide-gated potassium channel 2
VNQEYVHRKLKQLAVLVFELMLVLIGITHFSAMLWLIVAREERAAGATDTWYDGWNMSAASELEVYIDAVFWATATMTSIGYGDIFPQTHVERAFALIVMIIGATTYASLFGTFVVILDSLNEDQRKNFQLLEQTKSWAKLRGITEDKIGRISHFYNFVRLNS